MSEYVQSLELRIKDNAGEAASGLTKLADAFREIKRNIGKGLGQGLEKAATQLTTFNQQISGVVSSDNLNKLERLASVLERICNATKGMSSVRGMASAFRRAAEQGSMGGAAVNSGTSYAARRSSAMADNVRETTRRITAEGWVEAKPISSQEANSLRRTAINVSDVEERTALAARAAKNYADEVNRAATASEKVKETSSGIPYSTKIPNPRVYATPQMMEERRRAYWERRGIDPSIAGKVKASEALKDNPTVQAALSTKEAMSDGVKAEVALGAASQHTEEVLKDQVKSSGQLNENTKETANSAQQAYAKYTQLKQQLAEMRSFAKDKNASVAERIYASAEVQRLREEIAKLSPMRAAINTVRDGFKNVANAIFSANSGLLGMFSGLMRVAKYRVFRSLIREITEGFSTGLANVREYSKAINGLYYQDMKGLDNSLLKMKNSLGAAVAPAIQALIPLFQTLSRWVITASNYINQFFALMNGASTWTRAVDVDAEQFEELKKSSAGAAKEMKNLLASWDELNIIQSQSGGGGGGNAKKDMNDYSKMFEEVDTFDSKIRDIVEFLKDNLPLVEKALGLVVGKLLGLKTGPILLTMGVILSFKEGYESGYNGESLSESLKKNIENTLTSALGGAMIGFRLTGTGTGAAVGFAVGAAISLVMNYVGWREGVKAQTRQRIKELKEKIRTTFGTDFYGLDVNAVVEKITFTINDIASKKADLESKIRTLEGAYTIAITSGVAPVSNYQSMARDVQTIIEGIEDQLSLTQSAINLGVAVTGMNVYDDNGNVITALSKGITTQEEIISNVGKRIGELLANGTKEEYEKVLPDIIHVLSTIAGIQEQAASTSEFITSSNSAISTLNEGEMSVEKIIAYQQTHEELVGNVREAAEKSYQLQLEEATKQYEMYADMLANPEKWEAAGQDVSWVTQATVDEAKTIMETIDNGYETYVNNFVNSIIGDDSKFLESVNEAYDKLIVQETGKHIGEINPSVAAAFIAQKYMIAENGAGVSGYSQVKINEAGELEIQGIRVMDAQGGVLGLNGGESRISNWWDAAKGLGALFTGELWSSVGAEFDALFSGEDLTEAMASTEASKKQQQILNTVVTQMNGAMVNSIPEDELVAMRTAENGTKYGELWAGILQGQYQGLQSIAGDYWFIVDVNGEYYGIPANWSKSDTDRLQQLDYESLLQDNFFRRFDQDPLGESDGRRRNPGMTLAGAGFVTDVPYINASQVVVTGATVETDDGDRDDDDTNMLELIRLTREGNNKLDALLRKEIKVNPSATWGIFNRRSEQMANALIG